MILSFVNFNALFFSLFLCDLAARNILIDEQKQLKISDFGLSRSIIYVAQGMKKVCITTLLVCVCGFFVHVVAFLMIDYMNFMN